MRTISGLPVGYQMHLEQVQYQLRQANDALKVLYYERDQSDTEACIAEISRLAAMGYNVGEYEVGELKKKPREERPAFLHHIATHYERVGTDMPPTILGDPTPGPVDNPNRPASRDEMEAALKMSANSPDPNAFTQALHYVRTNGGPNRIAAFNAPPPQYNDAYGTWPEGEPAPQPGFDPTQPYEEPSANGNGY